MIHQVERIAWVVCMSLCVHDCIKHTHTIFTRTSAAALIKFFAPQMRCLFEGASYLRAALIQKLDAAKKKTLKTDYLHLLTFLSQMRRLFEGGACSGAALIRVNTVNHSKT